MARETRFYNQAAHAVVIAGPDFRRNLTDFAEGDDAIAAEPTGDRVALTQGFDKSILSFSSVDGGKVTVKLKPTSPEIGLLNKLFNRQRTTPILFDVYITTGVEDQVVLRNCGVMKQAIQSGGPTAQDRTFDFIGTEMDWPEDEG